MRPEAAAPTDDLVAQAAKAGLRDIVALSTLPAIWLGAQPLRIAESLAASLYTMLDAEFVHVGFAGPLGTPITVAQTGRYDTDAALAAELGPVVVDWSQAHDPDELLEWRRGGEPVRIAVRRLGLDAAAGVIAAGFAAGRSGPTPLHHLLLNIAATQASTAVQNAQLLLALRDSVAERDRSVRALVESEARFRGMADGAPVMVWMTERDGSCAFLSRSWYEFTGQTPRDGLGAGWLDAVHPDDRERSRSRLAEAEASRIEYRLRRADGVYRWAIDSAVPRLGAAGEHLGFIGSVLDISERKAAEVALEEQARDLHRSNAELEQFAYVAAHDLQEPLRTISLQTDLLLRRLRDDPAVAAQGRRIVAATARMRTLLSDLLVYSRVVHGGDEEDLLVTELDEAVAGAKQTLAEVIARTGAVIRAEPLPRVRASPAHAMVVFQNLISNAIKYQAPGAVPEVAISAQRDGDRWVVSVRDNGIGFDPVHAERIFGLFKRLHGGGYPGTGLGLAICRRIVERSGGRIWAESAGDGAGATFRIAFPAPEGG